ncbi:MAG: DUF4870 domain-containing protein [Flavobacterium sp.]|nr:MAG: DUF4870 domain-containing protein [Flavobacterium sp.]
METTTNKNAATLVHLSALTQYFIPFGNFIFPIIIWSSTKKDSEFNDSHGRQAINFQLSLFLYSVLLAIIAIPILLYTVFSNISFSDIVNDSVSIESDFSVEKLTGIALVAVMAVILFTVMKVAEFFLIIYASVKAAYGEYYQYPITINFIKARPSEPTITDESASGEQEPTVSAEPIE